MWSRKTGTKEMHVHYLALENVFQLPMVGLCVWQAIQPSLLQEN